MKELIRKVLKESVYGKDLIEKGRVVTAMYNDIEDLLGNRNGFTGNQETGVTSIDDFFWYIIDLVDYKKDDDYRRVKKYLMDLNRLAGVPSNAIRLLSKIIMFKTKWDVWVEHQSEATRTYLQRGAKEDSKLIMLGWWLGLTSGCILTILVWSLFI